MATKPKARARTSQKSGNYTPLLTDDELLQQSITGISQQRCECMSDFIEGPLPQRGDDGYWLRLCDGDKWYRDKPGLEPGRQKRLHFLKRALYDLATVESDLKPGLQLRRHRFF